MQRMQLGGVIYEDLNGDGVRQKNETGNPLEPGVRDVPLTLLEKRGNDTEEVIFRTTNPDGTYQFDNVGFDRQELGTPLPQFVMVPEDRGEIVTTQTPDYSGTGAPQDGVTLQDSLVRSDLDFGWFRQMTVRGKVFEDLNANGQRDEGEPPLAGFHIDLDLNSDGSADYSVPTELDGTYEIIVRLTREQIANPNRTFSIRQDLSFSPGWEQSTADLAALPILSGSNPLNNDFGNFQRGAIRGHVFEDRNANGVDDNDPSLGDVTIQLDRLANPDGSGAERTTRSSSADKGEYEFQNLRPGRYLVTQLPITGAVQTTANPQVVELISGRNYLPALSQPQGSPNPLEVRVPELAFGDFYFGSIHGFAFHDNNANGTDESGDGRRTGAVIVLEIDSDSDGTFEASQRATTAESTGEYHFHQLGPGKYRVTEAIPTKSIATSEPPDVIELFSHDVHVGRSGQVAVDAKQTERVHRKLRFGAFEKVKLDGVKFEDRNGDGAKTNDEPLLAGWKIQLDFESNGTIDQTAVTDHNGHYEFADVGPGRHTIGERMQGNWDPTFPAAPGVHVVTTESGQDIGDLDFGNRRSPECDGFIFGATYDDLDRDSFRDLDDPGVPRQTVFVDLNNNGVLDSFRNYRSTGGAKIIPDAVGEAPGVLSSSRRVCGILGVVTDLEVSINIEHDRDSDLEMVLRSPEGTVIQLVEHLGESGQHFTNTVFDDEAATAIHAGTAPFTGSFRPQQLLSTFDGESSSGLWTLEIRDTEEDQGGRLLGWSLTFAGVREPAQATDEIGNFRLSDLGADTYHVRHVLTNGRVATTDNPLDVRLSTGEQQSIVFGSFQETPAWQNKTENRDVNADGFIVPLDALLVINEINSREISLAETGRLPLRTSDELFLYDVNGDDFASALDALLIINHLNSPGGEGETRPKQTERNSGITNGSDAGAALRLFRPTSVNDSGEGDPSAIAGAHDAVLVDKLALSQLFDQSISKRSKRRRSFLHT